MKDSLYFTMYFNGKDYEVPKKAPKFFNGYGIVKDILVYNISKYKGDVSCNFAHVIGLVDEDYNVIIDLTDKVDKIDVLPNNNIITYEHEQGEGYKIPYFRHYKVIDGKLETIMTFYDKPINVNDDILVVGGSLYSMEREKYLLKGFTKIDDFKKTDGVLNAQAWLCIESDSILPNSLKNGNNFYAQILTCYIDIDGNIITPLVSLTDFNMVFLSVDSQIQLDRIKDELTIQVRNHLNKQNNFLKLSRNKREK